MINHLKISLLPLLLISCYGVNSETSQIGDINATCQNQDAWKTLTKEYSADKIKDSSFIEGLKLVENHFIKPQYILYFESGPQEIIGCDYYSVRVAYSPDIYNGTVDGLTPALSDNQQARIRNRVLKLLYQYECPEGKKLLSEEMKAPAIFSKEYYKNK